MGVALGVAGLVGAGLNAVGSVEGGYAKSAMDSYQAQVAANNALLAQQRAKFDIQSGEAASFNRGMKTRAVVGQEKAAQGASGIDVNTGSAVDVRAGTESLGMLDALNIRSNAAKQAWSAEAEATSDTAQSQLDTAAASQDVTSGVLGGAGTLLSGSSSVGANWSKFQTAFG